MNVGLMETNGTPIVPLPLNFGNFSIPPDMVDLIDEHWFSFTPMNPRWHVILGIIMFFFTIISLSGNAVVISIFMNTKPLRTPPNMFVVNLAFSDFLMMFSMGPIMMINCYYETWALGPFMCELYGMFGSLYGCASIWTMVMIGVDRYNVIVKGLLSKPLTRKGAMLRIILIWIASAISTAIPLFGWNRYVPEGNLTACGLDYLKKDWFSRSYILVYSVFCYFIPLGIIIYSYFFIVKAVVNHESQMREQANRMNVASIRSAVLSPSEAEKTSVECKLAKIALMTISLWFMAWTPYLIINYIGIFEGSKITPLATIWGSVFAKANAIYNPIVYGISHPKYRNALKNKYPSLFCSSENQDQPVALQPQRPVVEESITTTTT